MGFEHIRIKVSRADHAKDLALPAYMTAGASGMDLHAAVADAQTISKGEVAVIPTGLVAAVPAGYELQVRPRSGMAANHGIGILNTPGTIDSDYRGEIKVIIINLGQNSFVIKRHQRIAQIVLCPVARALLEETDQLPPTTRSDGGFGHTG